MGGIVDQTSRTVALELPADLVDVIKKEAKRTHRSIARYLADLLVRQKEDAEDLKDIQAAKRKNAAPIKLDEAKRILGLAN